MEGSGPDVVIFPGFSLSSATYSGIAGRLAGGARVVVPHAFEAAETWGRGHVLDRLEATLDAAGVQRAVFVGHSFGGAYALDLAARAPQRVAALVLVDSDGLAGRWQLAADAVLGARVRWVGTVRSASDFAGTLLRHPLEVTRAALWGFWSRHDAQIAAVRGARVRSRVLWAERDTVVPPQAGRRIAERLDAPFRLVRAEPGQPPVTHNWPFLLPERFVTELRATGLVP